MIAQAKALLKYQWHNSANKLGQAPGQLSPVVATDNIHVMTYCLGSWPPTLPLRGTEDGGGILVLPGLGPDATYVTQRPPARTSDSAPRRPRK